MLNELKHKLTNLAKAPIRTSVRYLWERKHDNFLAILTFHRVSDSFDPQLQLPRGWNQTSSFEHQIKYLKKSYQVVSLFEGLQQLECQSLRGRCVAVTMDDGDRSVKTHAAPILKKHDCPATFFINSAYLNCRTLHYPFVIRYLANSPDPELRRLVKQEHFEYLRTLRITESVDEYQKLRSEIEPLADQIPDKQKFFITERDIENLDSRLFNIGLHGHEHQRFSMMSAQWQNDAIEKNISALQGFEHYRPIFALPFGSSRDWNSDTIRACIDHDVFFLTCTGGVNLGKSIEYRRIFSDGKQVSSLVSSEATGIL